jgi:hypothetical protein
VVLAVAAPGTFNRQAFPESPRDAVTATVAAYFDALADRDADRARSMLTQEAARRAPLTLTSGAALRDPGYHPPRGLRIAAVEVRDDVANVEGDYELDGGREPLLLPLIQDGANGERQGWSINELPTIPRPTGEHGYKVLLMAGTRIPYSTIDVAFHGSYVVSLPQDQMREVIDPVTVRSGVSETGVLRVRMRESARQSIEAQVRAYLDRCAARTEPWQLGCPFSANSLTSAKAVDWRITKYPQLEIKLASDGNAEVNGRLGEATVTVRGGSEVMCILGSCHRTVSTSFTVLGAAFATTDRVVFVPR